MRQDNMIINSNQLKSKQIGKHPLNLNQFIILWINFLHNIMVVGDIVKAINH